MPFEKKFKNAGDTKHIRVPIVYAELIEELMVIFDKKFIYPDMGFIVPWFRIKNRATFLIVF